jgi:hypothetical protein
MMTYRRRQGRRRHPYITGSPPEVNGSDLMVAARRIIEIEALTQAV